MANRLPFISVVVPTRDRPEIVGHCLESLALQRFNDFEVIVSDNHTGRPCKHVYDRFADERFKYVVPPRPLAMHDNWEFACGLATGEYLSVLIDKTVLRPSALEVVTRVLNDHPAELISWRSDFFDPLDASLEGEKGHCRPAYPSRVPCYYDPRKELVRRFRMNVRRGMEGVRYFFGKICFGAYSRSLVFRMRQLSGRLFYPISPDYTSMLAALALAKGAVDVGQSLLISLLTRISNGSLYDQHDDYALHFIRSFDSSDRLLDSLPIQHLYTSSHNCVARDYLFMRSTIGQSMRGLRLNWRELILRAKEDLDLRREWKDSARRISQYRIWQDYFDRLSLIDRAYIGLRLQMGRLPEFSLRTVVKQLLSALPGLGELLTEGYRCSISDGAIMTFNSVIEAAKCTDVNADTGS